MVGQAKPVESVAEEIKRLQKEISDRQTRLHFLVLGDPSKGVSMQTLPTNDFTKRIL